jgi:hypothetical protein
MSRRVAQITVANQIQAWQRRATAMTPCHTPPATLHCRLELQLVLLSEARAVAGDITAVVTYDVSRLYMLEGLCLLWGGPLAAAVYVVRPRASD